MTQTKIKNKKGETHPFLLVKFQIFLVIENTWIIR